MAFIPTVQNISRHILTIIFSLFSVLLFAQSNTKVFTSDINNFWAAYDSVLKIQDTTTQKQIIQTLYMDKASEGLKDFMELRQHSSSRHLKNMLSYPKFWGSVRAKTLDIESHRNEMEQIMSRFKRIYPAFTQPELYFTIGCLNSGGTIRDNKVLIGSEIAASDKTVDARELSPFLQGVFKLQANIVYLVTHETVHTQQKGNMSTNLLTACLAEGSADFIAEFLMEKPVMTPYKEYGTAHEEELWNKLKNQLYGSEFKDWLYNNRTSSHPDLGYFMGYQICKSYYEKRKNKLKAIAEILDLKYSDKKKIDRFFRKSGYAEKWKDKGTGDNE